jgi:hypothetical protein
MSWADKTIANPMGYARAVLFPRARDALYVYLTFCEKRVKLPICICPEIAGMINSKDFLDVDRTGMAPGTQLYGYRMDHSEDLDLDPLLTGWNSKPTSLHRLISLGRHKILPLCGGGAFCTNDLNIADELEKHSFFNPGSDNSYIEKIEMCFKHLPEVIHARWQQIDIWNRCLGDMLDRIPREQVMPWRCMRLAPVPKRGAIIRALREAGIAVSVNYPAFSGGQYFPGGMYWEQRVISFPLLPLGSDDAEKYVFRAVRTIYEALAAK